jgi:hypothetical protein
MQRAPWPYGCVMPIKKRLRIEPTHDWQQLALLVEGPEQCAYAVLRPCVLFGQSPR